MHDAKLEAMCPLRSLFDCYQIYILYITEYTIYLYLKYCDTNKNLLIDLSCPALLLAVKTDLRTVIMGGAKYFNEHT